VTSASQFPLPTDLAGVTVTIGRRPAPIFAIANSGNIQQINVQVSSESASSDVVIQASDQAFSTFAAFRKSPGDFFTNADGSGVFQHASDFFASHFAEPGAQVERLSSRISRAWPIEPGLRLKEPAKSSIFRKFAWLFFAPVCALRSAGSQRICHRWRCRWVWPDTAGGKGFRGY
jgi:hypothetical protein